MRKWYKDIDAQRAIQHEERTARHTGTSDSEFTYLRNGPQMPNPYQQEYDAEEELGRESAVFSEFPVSRNTSSTSLRARSATGGSGGSGPLSAGRPPRFPMPEPPLSLHTQFSGGAGSPAERNGGSYFSPMTEAPSARSSSQSTMYYSRQGTPTNTYNEDSNRYTAPATSRATSRDGSNVNPYFSNARGAQRPSLPPLSGPQNPQSNGTNQSRSRSASSPDIHNQNGNQSDSRRYMSNGHMMHTVDNVPVPPIPAHMANMMAPVNRNQNNNSPPNNAFPIRSATGSPQLQHQHSQRHAHPGQYQDPHYSNRPPTSVPNSTQSPPPDQSLSPTQTHENDQQSFMPSQLKAKVNFDDNYVTLVIASNILFRSLIDRVDAKLARFTNRSIGSKTVRLRYQDEDGDFVTIDSDEAVQLAFMEWRDQNQHLLAAGQVGEIQLFCQIVEN